VGERLANMLRAKRNYATMAPLDVISPKQCTGYAGCFSKSQCALVCCVAACVPNPDVEESKEQLLAKVRELHPGKQF
jgi:hypothetical protein